MPSSITLTDISLRALKSDKQTEHWDVKLAGFGVRVGPRSKTFIVKTGNSRKAVGTYPDMSLAEARKEAHRLKSSAKVSTVNW